MPRWVDDSVAEFAKRMPVDFSLDVKSVPLAPRSRSGSPKQYNDKEAASLLAQVSSDDYVIALEIVGKTQSTMQMADRIRDLRDSGRHISFLIGGPDGLGEPCRVRADEQWSLSMLTLPHSLVRVILAEQLYRAWSILNNHPYHRE